MAFDRLARLALAAALLLSPSLAACDREDVRDVREGVRDVEKGAEDLGEEVEQELDELDTDGKDN